MTVQPYSYKSMLSTGGKDFVLMCLGSYVLILTFKCYLIFIVDMNYTIIRLQESDEYPDLQNVGFLLWKEIFVLGFTSRGGYCRRAVETWLD